MPSLSSFCAALNPGESALDEKGADAARAGLRIGLRVHHQHIRVGAVGDPHLAPVEHVAARRACARAAASTRRPSPHPAPTWRAIRRARRSGASADSGASAPRWHSARSGSRRDWSARRSSSRRRPRRARSPPSRRYVRHSRGRHRRARAARSSRAVRARPLRPTDRAGTGCCGRSPRRAARCARPRNGAPDRARRRSPLLDRN